jgi:hypothetical protein
MNEIVIEEKGDFMSTTNLDKIDYFINSYLNLASRKLNEKAFIEHKKVFQNFINSNNCSKELILQLITNLLGKEDNHKLNYNEKSLNTIVEECENFIKKHCLTKEFSVISDTEAVEEISDIIYNTFHLHTFKSGNLELSFILSAFLLNQVQKPYFILAQVDKQEFDEAIQDILSLKILFANKYKSYIRGKRGQDLKVVDVYDNASQYQSEDGHETRIMEWHELNRSLDEWEKLVSKK